LTDFLSILPNQIFLARGAAKNAFHGSLAATRRLMINPVRLYRWIGLFWKSPAFRFWSFPTQLALGRQ